MGTSKAQIRPLGLSGGQLCYVRAPLLSAAMGTLLSGLVAVHVLTVGSRERSQTKWHCPRDPPHRHHSRARKGCLQGTSNPLLPLRSHSGSKLNE